MGPENRQRATKFRSARLIAAAFAGLVVIGALIVLPWALRSTAPVPVSLAQEQSDPGIRGSADGIDLADHSGSVVVVNFMAGWCTSCWAEIPGLVAVYESYRPQGLVMLGISLQTPRDQTEAMISQLAIPYPVYQDEQGQVARTSFGLRAMPTTFVFDRQGELVRRLEGEVSESVLRVTVEEVL